MAKMKGLGERTAEVDRAGDRMGESGPLGNEEAEKRTLRELEQLFEKANLNFLSKNQRLLKLQVAERTLCGAFMLELNYLLQATGYSGYYTDVEYNRNIKNRIGLHIKTASGPFDVWTRINCDLIVHSRGERPDRDNLIAIEMKKSRASKKAKNADRFRLGALTRKNRSELNCEGDQSLAEHVCGYHLGVFYEINFKKACIFIEYYGDGVLYQAYRVDFSGRCQR